MNRLTVARSALPFVASYCGRQEGCGDIAAFDLWTLRVTLSPALVAGSTVAEETLLAWLAGASEGAVGDAMLGGVAGEDRVQATHDGLRRTAAELSGRDHWRRCEQTATAGHEQDWYGAEL